MASERKIQNTCGSLIMQDSEQSSKNLLSKQKDKCEISKFKSKYKSPYRTINRAKSSCSSSFRSQEHNFIKSNKQRVQQCQDCISNEKKIVAL